MRSIVLTVPDHIAPFNEPARELRVQNKPLWLWQRDLLAPFTASACEYPDVETAVNHEKEETEYLVQADNLFFNQKFITAFINKARKNGQPVQLAFEATDPSIATHVKPLTHSFIEKNGLLLANMWYLPQNMSQLSEAEPLIIDTGSRERGYYHVPPFMATGAGDLVYQLPQKAFVLIEHWVHVFIADILFGVFGHGVNIEEEIETDWRFKLKILFRSIYEQEHLLSTSQLIQIGKNSSIDSSAIIHGPTIIGDNVTIGANTMIDNCIIGDNVNISQGCQLMLSVVGDGCFLPFKAALFMTTLMENSMVAQNACLQLCVIGRDSFIGAGTTFTDFNILSGALKGVTDAGVLEKTNLRVLGGCVGHHCRLSSGLIIYPARTIESDVVLFASGKNRFITHNISYEESDHHQYINKYPFPRLYPRKMN